MEEETRKTVITLSPGAAKPIPVNSEQARNLKIQEFNKIIDEEIKKEEVEIVKPITVDNNYNINQQQVENINNVVRVVEVKNNKKVVLILLLVLAILVFIFVVFELPMIRGM